MTKISLKAALVLLFLLLSGPLVFAQQAENTNSKQLPQNTTAESSQAQSDNSDMFSNWNQTVNQVPADSPSTLGLFVRMVLVLALVVAAIYGLMKVLKKGMKIGNDDNDPFLRRVSQVTLGPGKSVQIVTLFNHAYLVGVTDSSVNLLGEISDKELVDSMNLYSDQHANVSKPRSFADILNIFMPNGPRAEEETPQTRSASESDNVFTNSAESAAEELQRQRDRLNGEEL
ncbi:MAG: flagellar biosynthetic protein FliO [Treponema sp.]|nr:flagellar biosynthetic protein FliO [Treponema sp.]